MGVQPPVPGGGTELRFVVLDRRIGSRSEPRHGDVVDQCAVGSSDPTTQAALLVEAHPSILSIGVEI